MAAVARRTWRRIKAHPWRTGAALLAAGFVLLNALAFAHAGAMTTFVVGGRATGKPEELSLRARASAVLLGVRVRRPVNDEVPADRGWLAETHTLEVDGLRLEAWHLPLPQARGVVLLCHGYAGSKSSLLPAAGALRELGWASLLLDFRGSGGSEGNQTSLGYHEARDVAAGLGLARRLARGRPVVILGTSMGAAAALRAVAEEGARPDGLVLEAPYDRLLQTVRNRFRLMDLPPSPGAELLVFWGSVRGGIDGFAHDPRDYARAVRCPTLVLHGDRDRRVSVGEVRAVADAIPAEHRALHLLEGVAHESYVLVRRETWSRVVGAHVERVAAASPPSCEGGSARPATTR